MLPPRPKMPQLIRNLNLALRPLEYMDAYSQRYGDFFMVGSQKFPVVYFSHPQAIEELFTTPPEKFTVGRGNQIRFLVGDNSLLLLDGERHQQQRRLLMPPFHGDRLRSYAQLICQITEQVTAHWQGQPFVVRSSMQEITLCVILQAVFGIYSGERFESLRRLLGQLLDSTSSPLSAMPLFFPSLQKDWGPLSPWGRFLRLRQQVKALIDDEIAQRHRSSLGGSDILSLLMSARDENGQPMTDDELHDELMTLLVAGHETTASALSWALYWIHHLPEVQSKLRHELAAADLDDFNQVARLPYLNAVCSETLRIYPIALTTFPRITKVPVPLMNYEFDAGTALIPCVYLTHHREEIYPEPKRFQPERFLQRRYSAYEYLPFGGGHRRCIGQALALLEMKLVLTTILSRYQLALVDSGPVKPVRRGLTVAPPSGLRMVAKVTED